MKEAAMRSHVVCALLPGILLLCCRGAAWGAEDGVPSARLVRLDPAPVIDGRLDDAAWEQATRLELEHLLKTRHDRHAPGETPEVRTRVLLGYDDEWLYIGVDCDEEGRMPLADQRGPDNLAVLSDDSLELFLQYAPGAYYHFMVGAGGATREQRLVHGRRDMAWTAEYRVAVEVYDGGWSVEWAIPLYLLGDEIFAETLGFNLGRNRQQMGPRARLFTWAPLAGNFHVPERFGRLAGLGGRPVPAVLAPRIARARIPEPFGTRDDGFMYRLELRVENPGGKGGEVPLVLWERFDDGRVAQRAPGTLAVPASGREDYTFILNTETAAARVVTVGFEGDTLERGIRVAGDSLLGPDVRPVPAAETAGYGADHAMPGAPLGGGEGYGRLVDPASADAVVDSAAALLEVLQAWNARPPAENEGKVIWIPATAELDIADVLPPGAIRPYQAFLTVPAGVTLAGDRGRDGSQGGLLRYSYEGDQILEDLQHRTLVLLEPGARLTGLRLRGADSGHLDPPPHTGSRMRGVRVSADAEVDNCRISHFHWACVEVHAVAGKASHNELSDSAYPVLVSGTGYALITGNRIRWGWHAIAGGGQQGSGYEARHNEFVHIGPGGGAHAVDMHAWRAMMRGHGPEYPYLSIAGDRIVIENNTFRDDMDSILRYRELNRREGEVLPSVDIAIRGVPRDLARIERNLFNDPDPGSAVRFPSNIAGPPGMHDQANLWVADNLYGPERYLVPLARETRPRIVFESPALEIPRLENRRWSTRHVNLIAPGGSLPVEVLVELPEPLHLRRVIVTAGNRDTDERVLFDAPRAPETGEIVLRAGDWDPGVYYLTVAVTGEQGINGRHSTSFTVNPEP